jgi:hypothetical protein
MWNRNFATVIIVLVVAIMAEGSHGFLWLFEAPSMPIDIRYPSTYHFYTSLLILLVQ